MERMLRESYGGKMKWKLYLYWHIFGWYLTLEKRTYKSRVEYQVRVWKNTPYKRPPRKIVVTQGVEIDEDKIKE